MYVKRIYLRWRKRLRADGTLPSEAEVRKTRKLVMIEAHLIALVPLALRGVQYRAVGAALLLRRNLLIYGLGGLIVPFVGIKLIDMLLTVLGLV